MSSEQVTWTFDGFEGYLGLCRAMRKAVLVSIIVCSYLFSL